jgi:hypothetical protein
MRPRLYKIAHSSRTPVLAAKQATATIPIVMGAIGDPPRHWACSLTRRSATYTARAGPSPWGWKLRACPLRQLRETQVRGDWGCIRIYRPINVLASRLGRCDSRHKFSLRVHHFGRIDALSCVAVCLASIGCDYPGAQTESPVRTEKRTGLGGTPHVPGVSGGVGKEGFPRGIFRSVSLQGPDIPSKKLQPAI